METKTDMEFRAYVQPETEIVTVVTERFLESEPIESGEGCESIDDF